jgi:two-component system, OmpR family, phosphate regulon response regulator PhoB
VTVQPEANPAAKTVLICEDDSNLRTLVRLALGEGYRFFEAPDGPSALALARNTHPDLIVLDLMLPGQSGIDVLGELRRSDDLTETPVLVISAWAHADEAAIAAGADSFVAKPFDPDQLRDAAIALLEDDGRQG